MRRWLEKHSIALTLILVVAVMLMIFCFSAQTGEESGAMSGSITIWLVRLFQPDFDNMPEESRESLCYIVGLIIRKLAHFSEYALLGLALQIHIRQIQKRITILCPWLWAWGVGTVYAITDEVHQGFVAGRGPAVVDVMIDSAGVIAGVAVLMLVLHIRRQSLRGV